MSEGLRHGERNKVLIDPEDGESEELLVFDHATVLQNHYVNSVNGYETDVQIGAGDDAFNEPPGAVTKRLALILLDELDVYVEDRDIRVVDMSRDDVYEA